MVRILNETEIATIEFKILHRLSNWCRYSTINESYDPVRDFTGKLDRDERQLAKLETRKYVLARSRATATGRDLKTVLMEVQLECMTQLARLLAKTIDHVQVGIKDVVVEEDGEVCGVCQEDMEKEEEVGAMDCNHKFHHRCIVRWLRRKRTCPLCRFKLKEENYDF